mmetsp:Transcript_55519/g.146424  ORF Transcript_55519/g.146424 Transcript_55519/m.146424 type:complete len:181 (+) Transcript_55519:68-610(+)
MSAQGQFQRSLCNETAQQKANETDIEEKTNVQQSSRLARQVFVGGLPRTVNHTQLLEWARRTFPSQVAKAAIALDKQTHSISRGFGFVTFKTEEAAEHAVKIRMHNFDGRSVELKKAESISVTEGRRQASRRRLPCFMVVSSSGGSCQQGEPLRVDQLCKNTSDAHPGTLSRLRHILPSA